MKLVIDYLLESAFILGLLVAFYHLFLRKEAMFWFNRAYLLLSISMAALVPVLHFSFRFSSRESEELMLLTLDTVNVYASQSKAGLIAGLLMVPQVDWLYGLGAFILLIRLLWGLVKVGGLFRIRTANVFQGVKVIDLPGRFAPFSFFNVIFMNQSGYSDKDLDQVLTHERAHVQLKHSLDVILVELFLIIQWFNPFAWLLRHQLKELHEFQADRCVLDKGTFIGHYKALLLKQVTGAQLLPVNSFNQSLTTKRFKMMNLNKINPFCKVKSYLAMFLLAGLVMLFSCETSTPENEVVNDNPELSKLKCDSKETGEGILADVMPEYPGGIPALQQFIQNHVQYPAEAKAKEQAGKVFVKFWVGISGQVKNAEVVRSSGYKLLDHEAIRVVNSLPAWQPGLKNGEPVEVDFTIPINFELQ